MPLLLTWAELSTSLYLNIRGESRYGFGLEVFAAPYNAIGPRSF